VKVSSSEYLLLAAFVEVAVKTVLGGKRVCLFSSKFYFAVHFVQKFISVCSYTWKSSCSLTIFHHVGLFILLLSYLQYNGD